MNLNYFPFGGSYLHLFNLIQHFFITSITPYLPLKILHRHYFLFPLGLL